MNKKLHIKNNRTGQYLAIIRIDRKGAKLIWSPYSGAAIKFDTDEEVRATINFILDVIDWELEGYLTIC